MGGWFTGREGVRVDLEGLVPYVCEEAVLHLVGVTIGLPTLFVSIVPSEMDNSNGVERGKAVDTHGLQRLGDCDSRTMGKRFTIVDFATRESISQDTLPSRICQVLCRIPSSRIIRV